MSQTNKICPHCGHIDSKFIKNHGGKIIEEN